MHVVIERFADLQDHNRIYEAGDSYPRPGFDVSAERLAELEGRDNLARKPLIKRVEAPETPVEAPQGEPNEIHAESAEPPKKARRSRQKG